MSLATNVELRNMLNKLHEHLLMNPLEKTLVHLERIIQKEIVIVFINDVNRTKREASQTVQLIRKTMTPIDPRISVFLCYNSAHPEDLEHEQEECEDQFEQDADKLYHLLERNSVEMENRSVILVAENHGAIVVRNALEELANSGKRIDSLVVISFGAWNAVLGKTEVSSNLYHIFCEGDVVNSETKSQFSRDHFESVREWGISAKEFELLFTVACSMQTIHTSKMPLSEEEEKQVLDQFLETIKSEEATVNWLSESLKQMKEMGLIFLPDSYKSDGQEFRNLWNHYIHYTY